MTVRYAKRHAYTDANGRRAPSKFPWWCDGTREYEAEFAQWSCLLLAAHPEWTHARAQQRAMVMAFKAPRRISAGG